jgi:hypothetical protein
MLKKESWIQREGGKGSQAGENYQPTMAPM